ncbi:MAG: HDOD domain-containing protein [Nitrospirota bacterium]|nr:HDOD domain-containing protein [Nitrospirota bacterium]MDH5700208.1 HDOD domain-containing protein [Nitrospirota bacterium]
MTSTAAPSINHSVLVGRQAIFDRQKEVFGYELLYRDGQTNSAQVVDGDEATARVMVNTFLEMGIDHIAGTGQAFINMTANFFLSQNYEVLPKNNVVLEVLESIEPTPLVMQSLARARQLGYQIALDDFIVRDSHRALLEVADFVKVDILALTSQQLLEQIDVLKQYPVRLLAEKVEDQEVFTLCYEQGFEYFQGYFFCKPQIMEGVKLSGNRMAIVLLLAKLQDPDIKMEDLEELVENDLSLSLKLLRFVNSASVGLPRVVNSIGQAVGMVGTDRMRQWASLLILANNSGKPSELMRIALIRGRMCQGLSRLQGESASQGFTVGLFSVLDAYFDCEMKQLLADLPLASDILLALTERQGCLGEILACVISYERGEWNQVESSRFEPQVLRHEYFLSAEWAQEVMNATLAGKGK